MYKPSKRILVVGLSAGLLVGMSGANITSQAGQKYDKSNVGITGKVGEYIKNGNSSDPVAELTAGAATKEEKAPAAKTEEKKPVEEASSNDAKSEKKSSVEAKVYPQFQDRAVVVCDGQVNIREKDSTDSEVIGYLQNGGICLVDEIGKEWTKIESGCCVGYIANEFLLYGDDAGEWSDNNGIDRYATVNTATLKVRESKDENSDCVTLIPEGEEYYVYSNSNDWVELRIDDDLQGFVRSEYVTIVYDNPRAVSVEEQEEADRIAQEEADRAWLAYLDEQKALNESQNNSESSNGEGSSLVADGSNDDGLGNLGVAAGPDENGDAAPADDANTDDANTDDANTDDGTTDDANTDDGTTDDSNTDDSNTDDGSTDDSNTDDGSTDDSNTDDGSTDDSNTDDGSTDDSNTDDGSTDDSNTDDGSTDDSNTDDSNVDDGESGDSSSESSDASDSSDSSSADDVSLGQQVANFALQFVGNPYVWGGTSLTDGADCSGFVLSVYAHFGYSLPHDAELQANYGTEVSLSDLQPGDLLFYSNGYEIGHVTLYIGDGMVVHASNSRDGIKTSVYNYRTPVKAVRLIGS